MCVQVLLLDEVTVDLDVVARMDLLNFFVQECDQVRRNESSATRRFFDSAKITAASAQLAPRCTT